MLKDLNVTSIMKNTEILPTTASMLRLCSILMQNLCSRSFLEPSIMSSKGHSKVVSLATVFVPFAQPGTTKWLGARGPFFEGPEKFSHPESRSKISNLIITELFYLHILNMTSSSLHTKSFKRIHLSVLDTD